MNSPGSSSSSAQSICPVTHVENNTNCNAIQLMKTAADSRITVSGSLESIVHFKTLLFSNWVWAATSPQHHKVPFLRLSNGDAPIEKFATHVWIGRCSGRCRCCRVSLCYRILLIAANNIPIQRTTQGICRLLLFYGAVEKCSFFLFSVCRAVWCYYIHSRAPHAHTHANTQKM